MPGLLKTTPLVLSLFALVACTEPMQQAQSNLPTKKITQAWGQWTGTWNKSQSEYKFVVHVTEIDGMAAVCGVRATKGAGNKRINQKRMAATRFLVDGQVLMNNLSYFALSQDWDNILDTPGNCMVTTTPFRAQLQDFDRWSLGRRGDGSYRL